MPHTSLAANIMASNSKTPTSRPGAMSLLDKYSSINASIEDARRRVVEVRSALERANEKNLSLREERNGMLAEAERAASDQMRLAAELKEAKVAHRAKLAEMEGVRRDHRIARSEYDGARRRIDEERIAFLEGCREFRSAIKRVRVASSIFVLEGGEDFDPNMVATDEVDLWRGLLRDDGDDEYDEYDDDEAEQEGDGNSNQDLERSEKRKRKKPDPEVEQAERDEKESRHALIEVECALHDERMKIDEAAKRSNARNQRLTQQRAQLQRHRKEVEEMEREIQLVKDDIVQENQLANTFEKGEG
jgi:chromosome segregation ATPase